MMTLLIVLAAAAEAYLLGSIDTGILVSKYLYHDDVRNYGSGAAGMTNMLRTFGKKAAALTAVGDVLKGVRWRSASAGGCSAICRQTRRSRPTWASTWRPSWLSLATLKPHLFRLQGRQGRAGGRWCHSGHPTHPASRSCSLIFLACLLPTGMVSLGSITMAARLPGADPHLQLLPGPGCG